MKRIVLFLALWCLYCSAAMAQATTVHMPQQAQLRFTENKGQWHSNISYRSRIPGGSVWLEKNAFYFFLYSAQDMGHAHHPGDGESHTIRGHSFREEFVGANLNPQLNPKSAFGDYANYYLGNDPTRWATGVKIYEQVNYANVYDGIDLAVYTQHNSQLKYDWILKPHADASKIKVRYNGVDELRIKNGELRIKLSTGEVAEEKPFAYQPINGSKKPVKCNFVLTGNEVSFELPDGYDENFELVIDPTIVFSTYTGATGDNWGYTATYDAAGNMYVGGYVNNDDPGSTYPTTPGAFQTVWGGGTGLNGTPTPPGSGNGIGFACDMGITKFSANGTQMLYSTYIGGNDNETPHSLVVDPQNNLIIYGVAYSANYPVLGNAYDNSYNGNGDIVVTKLNAAGTALLGSTFLGGVGTDGINFDPGEFTSGQLKRNYGDQNRGEVNVDAANNIYVASCTQSFDYPCTGGAIQSVYGGSQDGCAFKLNSNCSALLWSTFLGGTSDDACYSLDLGPNGTLYVAGGTMSNNFPTTAGTLHSTYQGGMYDGFVAHINATGTQLLSSSYVGTSGNDQVYFVKLDATGNVYFVGQTDGNYPIQNAPYSNANSGQFITKTNPALANIFYSTRFGSGIGRPNISPTAFLVDTCENVYVSGWGTNSNSFPNFQNNMYNMPLTPDALQSTTDGTDFYFFVLAKNAQNILYGSYFGANGGIEHVDGGTSRFDKRGVIYEAICAGCGNNNGNGSPQTPTTPGVVGPVNLSANCNELGLKIEFNLSGTQVAIDAYPRATGCVPLTVQFQATSNAQSITWYLADSVTSNQLNPVYTYTDTGTYRVMLVGIDSNSCNIADTAYLDVWVRDDSIAANFLPNLNIDCYTNSITLRTESYSSANYAWTMGDGAQYNTDSISHTYAGPGTYNIRLIVSDTTRCSLADTFTSQVIIPQQVDANFAASSTGGCIPLTVNFNAPFVPTATYFWDFGDSTTSNQNNNTHTYTYVDSFAVQLIVVDSSSCNIRDTANAIIVTIDSSADAAFGFTRRFFGCDSVQVTVWANYTGEDSQVWDFGDGTQLNNVDTAYHVYNTAGTFTITHTLTDLSMFCKPVDTEQIAISLVPLNVSMTIPDTGGCYPFTANFIGSSVLLSTDFVWYFGDGSSLSGDTVSHTYNNVGTFNVVVLATDTNACVGTDSAFGQVTVINDSVHADFNLIVLNDCDSNLVLDLVNTSTNAVDNFWDFGDGTTSTNVNENHSYNMPGTYTITLIVQDTNRCHPLDTISKDAVLLPNVFVDFTADDVCLGTSVQFNNLGSPTASYTWNFGDATISSQYSPGHFYNAIGIKQVELTIVDTTTCDVTATVTHPVQVFAQPIADFTTDGDTFKFEFPVEFINRSFAYQNLYWDFGDGSSSVEENPVHTYESIYTKTVCLQASNNACADTICKNIFISFTGLVGVPNAFSPNGDGINDEVRVEGRGIVGLTFRIYNRWGEKVFETNDQSIGWNGIFRGVLQEMEV
ncbi:MAG TPA: PKD domain-containing protein, partial [Chitinophagales bacterium]|nr:PKD domain-containing protein [Chitinophagales bacterium]